MGTDDVNEYINTVMSGSMDTERFLVITIRYIFSYLIVEGILLLIGLPFFVYFFMNYL